MKKVFNIFKKTWFFMLLVGAFYSIFCQMTDQSGKYTITMIFIAACMVYCGLMEVSKTINDRFGDYLDLKIAEERQRLKEKEEENG